MKEIPRSLNGSEVDRSFTEIVLVFECAECGRVWEPLVNVFCYCPRATKSPDEWTVEYRTISDVLRQVFPPCVALV